MRLSYSIRVVLVAFVLLQPLVLFIPAAAAVPAHSSLVPSGIQLSVAPQTGLTKELARTELGDTTTANLSGAFPQVWRAAYQVPINSLNEIPLANFAIVYWTKNGSQPSAASPQLRLTAEAGGSETNRAYRATQLAANFTGAVDGAVRFIVEIYRQAPGSAATAIGCDRGLSAGITAGACPNSAAGITAYRFHVDTSRPARVLAQQVPAATTANPLWGTTTDRDTRVQSVLLDVNSTAANDRSWTHIDPSTIRVFYQNGTNARIQVCGAGTATGNARGNITTVLPTNNNVPVGTPIFTCAAGTAVNLAPGTRFVYRHAPPTTIGLGLWGQNPSDQAARNHTFSWTAQDYAGNIVASAPNNYTVFRADTLAPAIPTNDINVRPEHKQAGTAPWLVGKGVRVTLQANVQDPNLNRASTTDVSGRFINTTSGLDVAVPMRYNSSSQRWEGTGVVPTTFASTTTLNVSAEIRARDALGHIATPVVRANVFRLEPFPPVATLSSLNPSFGRAGPYEFRGVVTDTGGSGLNTTNVRFYVTNTTGAFNTTGTGGATFTKVPGTTNQFFAVMTQQGTTSNYTINVPDQPSGVTLLYNITARDRAGSLGISASGTFRVDKQGPFVGIANTTGWRGPNTLRFTIVGLDLAPGGADGSGVNQTAPGTFFHRVAGASSYNSVALNGSAGLYFAQVPTTGLNHKDKVEYYVEMQDRLGNIGRNGTSGAPRNFTYDSVKPTATLDPPPATSTDGKFPLTAVVSDADSGVSKIVFQGRLRANTATQFGPWLELQNSTSPGIGEVCLAPGATYEFRVFAIDVAGNVGDPSEARTVQVTAPGCSDDIVVSVLRPVAGGLVDGQRGSATTRVEYAASSSGTFTASEFLRIRLEFSPDGGHFWVRLADDLANTGNYTWNVNGPTCDDCRLRVTASIPGGKNGTVTGAPFQIINGNPTADLNGNGIHDTCEIRYFERLGVADPRGDPDRDGLTTLAECNTHGTDPLNADSDFDGFLDGLEIRLGRDPLNPNDMPSTQEARLSQWGSYYLLIPLVFLVIAAVFLLGAVRRW
jgi:hypothetical protein